VRCRRVRGGLLAGDGTASGPPRTRLLAGDVTAAQAIGLDPSHLANRLPGPPTPGEIAFVRPMVEKASLALCVNEAWVMLAGVAVMGFLLVFLLVFLPTDRAKP
jgi:hypothetical protein